MKVFLLAMLPLLIAAPLHAQSPITEAQAVEYSKSIDVKTLDLSLSSQPLEDWLRSGPPHVQLLRWESDETCDNRPYGDRDYPRCVRITFGRGGQSGYSLLRIGTRHKGIIGPPQLYEGIGVEESIVIQTGSTDRLSGIPHLLDQPVVADGVDEFYQRIVQRHPIGIPTAADQAALWPFLSQRLIQKLETARACQADFLLQHPHADATPKPAWLDTGLFAGNSKRALPLSAFAVHKEPQKNGSFAVTVNLTYVKLPGFVPDEAGWEVVATVIPENNRYVVDNVRLFDGIDTNGPSHLLTETFVGCDGAHWTGEHVTGQPPAPLPRPHYTDWDAINALRSVTYDEEVAFAKTIDVHELDPSLPSQHLDDWLRSLSATHLTWDGLKCNIKEGQHGRDYVVTRNPEGGLCAEVWFQRGNAQASIRVRSAAGSSARSAKIYVRDKDDGLLTPVMDTNDPPPDSDQLSDLPRLLKEQSVIDVTRNLYNAIVERHPLGIPRGQDMVSIAPLLSKRLREQLELAQDCENDFLRQHPHPSTKPAWFNAGLFTGDGKLAFPTAALVDRKQRQQDGSFQVSVWLSRHNAYAPASGPPASRWKTWHVFALAKSENDRFVIDEVRLFGYDSPGSPYRLLSDSFNDCNGSHWVGTSVSVR